MATVRKGVPAGRANDEQRLTRCFVKVLSPWPVDPCRHALHHRDRKAVLCCTDEDAPLNAAAHPAIGTPKMDEIRNGSFGHSKPDRLDERAGQFCEIGFSIEEWKSK